MRLLDSTILDHWHCRFEDLQHSSKAFYETVETVLKDSAYPDIYYHRDITAAGGLFSSRREYLRVGKDNFQFVIYAGPFGKSYFVSWWLKHTPGIEVLLKTIPFIGNRLYQLAIKQTLYETDTEIMFKESIKDVVNRCIAEMGHAKGMREIGLNATITI